MNFFRRLCLLTLCIPAFAQVLPAAEPVSYERDIHPLLAERCYKCHGGDERRGGLSMMSRESVIEGSEFGPVVSIGKSGESVLIERVTSTDEDERMPPKGDPLSEEQVNLLRAWIDEGLVWDAADPLGDDGWNASIEPRRPDVPENDGIHGSTHPIDRFIRAYWDKHGIDVPPVVSDAVFLRRAYLDVTGLLPTVDALDAFIADESESKREDAIDRLLASDRDYAEHWMSFWNDALRNDFQGTGYIDGGRKQITQWLYDALYYNKTYDQFVRELIHPSAGSRGFIDGIVWRGVTAAAQRPPVQAARSVAQVFMGVNLKCASCHDSFVDEWKLTDSYGLANSFSDEPLELVRCDVPTGRIAETKFLWPELGAIDGDAPRGVRMRRLAEIVTSPENGRFTRTMVNRMWAKLMGRGLVEPLDAMGKRPWHPELLDWLGAEFAAQDYDLRALMRLIMTAKTYRLESADEAAGEYRFAGPSVKRLSAEAFSDALSRVTGVWQTDPKFSPPDEHPAAPDTGVRAWRIPSSPLTRALGRPNREQIVTRRENAYTTLQSLELTNGEYLDEYLNRAAAALDASLPGDSAARVETLYRRGLQRLPSAAEREVAVAILDANPGTQGLADLLWSMAMQPEFQMVY